MKTLLVIPAYNEELTIGSVVALARKFGDVLVVDDGSTYRAFDIAGNIKPKYNKNETWRSWNA
ncbi:MAG: Glycosyl transferase [Thermococcus sibiricus]|uniref:Glycosyl transferase n=2 Tax=Thermococcus sibiricus TaxID=172049 RepID=A0A124FF85_9EURY|nr:MAG: Glycosyl transferase [Thermococcus sibiricus]